MTFSCPTTTLENLGAREYNPTTGRFLSPDPILETTDPTQTNGYDYAANNPTTNSDPTGQCPPDKCGAGIPSGSGNGDILLTSPQTPNGGTIHNHHWYPVYHGQPWSRPKPSQGPARTPASLPSSVGGKAAGEHPPNYHPDPNAGPPAAEVGGVALLNLLVLAGNLFGDEATDPWLVEFDKNFWDSSQTQISQDEGCGPNSFSGDTHVLMADGTTKPIDQIKVGDTISNATPDELPGIKDQHHTVTAIHITHTDHDYTDVTIATPHGPATITGTAHHLYWDTTTHHWTQANQLHTGDLLQTTNGTTTPILSLHDHTATMVTYNLTINNLHTYYVDAVDTPVLVHNDSCGPTYENPGHHDPRGGPNPYNPNKAVLPADAESQFWNSVELDGVRWTKIGAGKKAVYYRYFNTGNDTWHWSGSSNGVTANGRPVGIPLNDIPIEVRRS